jgi:hypothetical protein
MVEHKHIVAKTHCPFASPSSPITHHHFLHLSPLVVFDIVDLKPKVNSPYLKFKITEGTLFGHPLSSRDVPKKMVIDNHRLYICNFSIKWKPLKSRTEGIWNIHQSNLVRSSSMFKHIVIMSLLFKLCAPHFHKYISSHA